MFRLIGSLLKLCVLSVVILVIGNWVRWDGKTVSDQIKTHLSHAERAGVTVKVKNWAADMIQDAHEGAVSAKKAVSRVSSTKKSETKDTYEIEEIPTSERQKLHALMGDLNHPNTTN